MRSLITQLEQTHGAFQSVSGTASGYAIHLARADVTAHIVLDDAGRIAGLRLTRIVPRGETAAEFAAQIEALPGTVSLLVTEGDHRVVAFHADAPLAVGSAFKLVVLRAVADAVAAHRLAWDQVVRLDPAWRSPPSGFLQGWPAETPVTIATLANAMISVSDNTAADALARLVGRDALDAASPRNAPFLTTREMFLLKAGAPGAGMAAWRSLTVAERRALIDAEKDAALPDSLSVPVILGGPEWYLSAEELCALLQTLSDNEAFRINPGPADPADWTRIAFKGGSEPGVLDLSVYGVAKDGRKVCASVTWNDTKAVEDAALVSPFAGLLHAAAKGP